MQRRTWKCWGLGALMRSNEEEMQPFLPPHTKPRKSLVISALRQLFWLGVWSAEGTVTGGQGLG